MLGRSARATRFAPNQTSLAILAGTLTVAGVVAALSVYIIPIVIEAGWSGSGPPVVASFFEGREDHQLAEYLADWQRLWHGLFINTLGIGALALVLARPEVRAIWHGLFGSTWGEVFHSTPKLLVAVVTLSLAVGEWYPFSQFPMYSRFADEGGYVVLTDGGDAPVAVRVQMDMGSDRLSKIFRENLERERQLAGVSTRAWHLGSELPRDSLVVAAARRTLLYLRDQRSATQAPLRLWRVRVTLEEGAVRRERELLAEVSAR